MALDLVAPSAPSQTYARINAAIAALNALGVAVSGKVDYSDFALALATLGALGDTVSNKVDFSDLQALGNTVSGKADYTDLVALSDRFNEMGIGAQIEKLRGELQDNFDAGLRTRAGQVAFQALKDDFAALVATVGRKADGTVFAGFTANVNALLNAFQGRLASGEAAAAAVRADLIARTDAAVAVSQGVLAHQIDPLSRPGDAPQAFTRSLAGGDPSALPPLTGADVVLGDDGAAVRMRGADLLAMRRAVAMERGRAYRARVSFARTADVSDPAGDAVRIGIQFLDRAKTPIQGTDGRYIVKDDLKLAVTDGPKEIQFLFSRSGGESTFKAPYRARYAVFFIQSFGADGSVDVSVLDIVDITDAAILPPASADLEGRVSGLEAGEFGERLALIEAQGSSALAITFRTLSDAERTDVPASITLVRLLGQQEAGDGGTGDYRRVVSLEPGQAGFQTKDGTFWALVTALRGNVTPALFRVRGDGVSDDTAGMQGFLNLGGLLFVPDGDYLVDRLTLTRPVCLVLSPKARLIQRSGGAAHRAILFGTGPAAAGSLIQGGIFDGRREVLGFGYPNLPRGDAGYVVWEGLRLEFVPDVTVRDTIFQNFANMAFNAAGCERFKANVKVRSCGQAFGLQGVSRPGVPYTSGLDVEVDARDISNRDATGRDYAIFQHGCEARFLRNSTIKAKIENFGGNKFGLEPLCIAFGFDSSDNCEFDLWVDGYTGDLVHLGAILNSHRNCVMRLYTARVEQALQVISGQNCTVYLQADGHYRNTAGYPREGLALVPGGVFPISGAGLAGETSSNLVTQDVTIYGFVQRFGIGIRIEGGGCTFIGVKSIGNDREGWQIVKSSQGTISFPGGTKIERNVSRTKLVACSARGNGYDGLIAIAADDVEIIGGDFNNNGQDPDGFSRSAISLQAEPGEIRNWVIADADLDETGDTAKPGSFTYMPGPSVNNRITIDVSNPNEYDLGEYVTLYGVLANGGNALGRVVDRLADTLTLRFKGPTALLVPASNLRAIGQGFSRGRTVTVPAGGLASGAGPILFRNYLKHPSRDEYRQIVYVNSDTEMVIEAAFSSDLPAGSPLSIVQGTIDRHVVSQTQALTVGGGVAGPLLVKGLRHKNLKNFFNFPSLGAIASGSEFRATYEVDVSVPIDIQTIVAGLPAGSQIVRAEMLVVEPIVGISPQTRGTFRLYDGGIGIFDFPAVAALAGQPAGTISTLHVPNTPAFQSNGGTLGLVLTGGADNLPSGGKIAIDLTIRRI